MARYSRAISTAFHVVVVCGFDVCALLSGTSKVLLKDSRDTDVFVQASRASEYAGCLQFSKMFIGE